MKWWRRLLGGWREVQEPFTFDSDYLDSDAWTDRTPLETNCPDTEPTSPGALDTLPERLE